MIRTIIVDDEFRSRETLREMIRLYCKSIEVVAEAESVKSAIEAINRHKPDLLLLDITMPDGTGFDLIREILPVSFKVVFVTAHEKYAIKAFKFNALDYITKPVDPVELQVAMEKATTFIENDNLNERLKKLLLGYMVQPPSENKRLILKTLEAIHVVDIEKIVRCESARNYTVFYLVNKESILISKSIKEFSATLESYGFFRVHHSHLINLKYLIRFKRDDLMCVLSDNSEIPVSTRKRDELLKVLNTL